MNISKKRLWSKPGDNNPYHTYYFTKKQRGDYFNMWFAGAPAKIGKKTYPVDQMWTLKKVDEETANHLYNRNVNPLCIMILESYSARKVDKNSTLCDMKVTLYSIDDSSYGIWWVAKSKEELHTIRREVMAWIDTQPILNGHKMIEACLAFGANEDQIDYN